MTLYIIRHGETELNRQNIVQGSGVDSNLNNTGRRQAQLFYQYYRTVKFDLVLTSALKRTHQTVEPFILRGGVEVMNMPELNEISWGVHEGKVGDLASAASYKTMINHWQSENYDARIEGGESAAELAIRVSSIITFLKNNHHKYTNVLLCTHGRTLLCLLTLMNEMPLRDMNFFKHNNTCLYKCHFVDGEFIFELENDLKHLGNLPTAGF